MNFPLPPQQPSFPFVYPFPMQFPYQQYPNQQYPTQPNQYP